MALCFDFSGLAVFFKNNSEKILCCMFICLPITVYCIIRFRKVSKCLFNQKIFLMKKVSNCLYKATVPLESGLEQT